MSSVKSKTLATWIAVVGGVLGLHRFYLHGFRSVLAWLHPLPTALGLLGIQRVQDFGVDDRLSWALLPILGLMITQAMLHAIVYGLMPDERWDARHHGGQRLTHSGWGAVLGVITALLIGATALMATIAFSGQRYFELQIEAAREISQ